QSLFGGIITAVNRDLNSPQLESALHDAAYAGGIDFRHEFRNRSWALFGDAEVSHVRGTEAAITATQRRSNHYFQRPDATHLEVDPAATSLTGYSVNLGLSKQGGRHWRGALGAAVVSPEYEVNDLGFAVRTDRADVQASLTYLQQQPSNVLRRWNVGIVGRSEHNHDWQSILNFVGVNASMQTLGYWSFNLNVQRFFKAYDDRLTRGGPLALRPQWLSVGGHASSDGRKPVTVTMGASAQNYEYGSWAWQTGLNIGIKTSTRWNLSVGPNIAKSFSRAQYVTQVPDTDYAPTFGRRYIFAPLHQTSVGLETRFNMTFSPTLTLETYVQPLLSSADYGSAEQFVRPKSFEFQPYAGSVPSLDFNLRSLRGNAVLRWEWREGSTIYVAWQQRRVDAQPYGDFDFSRDRRALFGTRPDNIFLVKMNYWLNP
ncbi:MAG TPA: DUF5916 domain-containing protein, partial [Gemmatimonadaceae bacterium]